MKTKIVPNCTCRGRVQSKRFLFGSMFEFNNFVLWKIRVNQMLRERSDATAATFIYLPKPPRIDSPNWSQTSLQYLELLTELTADLPPTVNEMIFSVEMQTVSDPQPNTFVLDSMKKGVSNLRLNLCNYSTPFYATTKM